MYVCAKYFFLTQIIFAVKVCVFCMHFSSSVFLPKYAYFVCIFFKRFPVKVCVFCMYFQLNVLAVTRAACNASRFFRSLLSFFRLLLRLLRLLLLGLLLFLSGARQSLFAPRDRSGYDAQRWRTLETAQGHSPLEDALFKVNEAFVQTFLVAFVPVVFAFPRVVAASAPGRGLAVLFQKGGRRISLHSPARVRAVAIVDAAEKALCALPLFFFST